MLALQYIPSSIPPKDALHQLWLHLEQIRDMVSPHLNQPYVQCSVRPIGHHTALQMNTIREWDDILLQKQLFTWIEQVLPWIPHIQNSENANELCIGLLRQPGCTFLYSQKNQALVWHFQGSTFKIRKQAHSGLWSWSSENIRPQDLLNLCDHILHDAWMGEEWRNDDAIRQLEFLTVHTELSTQTWNELQFIYLGWLLNNSDVQEHCTDLWQWVEHAYDHPAEALRMFLSTMNANKDALEQLDMDEDTETA